MIRVTPKSWLARFRSEERGSVTVEAMITLPLLIWAIGATYEFFEVHRYNSARDKASYTIADMISREQDDITPIYLDNAKTVFDTIANDMGANSLRISVIKYNTDDKTYFIKWSQVRGTDALKQLKTEDVENAHAVLPKLRRGEELIVVESQSIYPPVFKVGMGDNLKVRTYVTTSPRFAAQINYEPTPYDGSDTNTEGSTGEG
ncbi:hypothetical protein DC366_08340 [Pelagivirga sediminicola]|uniref:Pilus assembly protein n=1 Tax=Pelagivirga sediminicola TaxID=2170575 RepID=A0A2T7G749_9RHOB|nr:hypothetical protein [Pelagivirga sediminicola]PVA10248.1 hypothetical protein DC366_08340 [Pelagivirga sediminicola]